MGYTFLLEHPEAAKGVVGIYPLLTFDDYVGPAGFSPAWGLSVDQFNQVKGQNDPLANAASFTFPIFHLHGDSDQVVHEVNDLGFIGKAPHGTIQIVPGQGHEGYSVEFFHNDLVLQLIETIQRGG